MVVQTRMMRAQAMADAKAATDAAWAASSAQSRVSEAASPARASRHSSAHSSAPSTPSRSSTSSSISFRTAPWTPTCSFYSSDSSASSSSRSSSPSSSESPDPFHAPPHPSSHHRGCCSCPLLLLLPPLVLLLFFGLTTWHIPRPLAAAVAPPCHVRGNPNLLAPCAVKHAATSLAAALTMRDTKEAWQLLDNHIYLPADVEERQAWIRLPQKMRDQYPRLQPSYISNTFESLRHDMNDYHLWMPVRYDIPGVARRHLEVASHFSDQSSDQSSDHSWKAALRWCYQGLRTAGAYATASAYNLTMMTLEDWDVTVLQLLRASDGISSPAKVQGWLDNYIHPALVELYRLIDHLATQIDARPHKQDGLRPLLRYLRRIELRLLLTEGGLTVILERRNARLVFADQLGNATLQETLDILSCSSSSQSKPSTFAQVLQDIPVPCDWDLLLGQLDHVISTLWTPRLMQLDTQIMPEVQRFAIRRWAMEKWRACGDQDPGGIGCISLSSPFLSQWFEDDSGALFDAVNDFVRPNYHDLFNRPGVLDERRRPLFKGARLGMLDANWLPEKCVQLDSKPELWNVNGTEAKVWCG